MYVTYTECKTFSSDIPEIANGIQAFIEARITEAEFIIEFLTGQIFDEKEVAVEKVYDGNGQDILYLRTRLYTLTTFKIDDVAYTTEVNLEYDNDFACLKLDIDEAQESRLRFFYDWDKGSFFPEASQNLKIKGDWGWSSIPEAIKTLCKKLVENLAMNRKNIRTVISPFMSEKIGDYSYTRMVASDLINKLTLDGILDSQSLLYLAKYAWKTGIMDVI